VAAPSRTQRTRQCPPASSEPARCAHRRGSPPGTCGRARAPAFPRLCSPGRLAHTCVTPVGALQAQVPTTVIEAAAGPDDLRRFRQYALRSYVEDNRKLTWCAHWPRSPGRARVTRRDVAVDPAAPCSAHSCIHARMRSTIQLETNPLLAAPTAQPPAVQPRAPAARTRRLARAARRRSRAPAPGCWQPGRARGRPGLPASTGRQRARRCPAPGCEHAVEALVDLGAEPLDVSCACGAAFCFQCKEEAHRPVRPRRPGAAPRVPAAQRRRAAVPGGGAAACLLAFG